MMELLASLIGSGSAGVAGTGGLTGLAGSLLPASAANALSSIMPYLQAGGAVYNLVSPQGPVTRGDLMGILKAANAFNNNLTSIISPKSSAIGSPEVLGRGTVESFKTLAPDIQKEILRIIRQG